MIAAISLLVVILLAWGYVVASRKAIESLDWEND